ncbi:MAG TPA: response regulator [Thermoanaerobaculia bacterium]|nr:response regulator [Thermoanaerobaculia bacterium]
MEHAAREAPCILVVDDDPSIRRLIISTLRRDGYTLTEARNGREALDAMRRGDEDLVLLDLMMPEVTGWDVLRIREASPDLRRIPVIVITAAYGPELSEALGNGICALLPKPFDLAVLQAIVRTCLLPAPVTSV